MVDKYAHPLVIIMAIPWGATGRISAPTPSLTEHGGLFVAPTSGPVGCANRMLRKCL